MTDQEYVQERTWVERGFEKFDLYKMPVGDVVKKLQKISEAATLKTYVDVQVSVAGDQVVVSGKRQETREEVLERLAVEK